MYDALLVFFSGPVRKCWRNGDKTFRQVNGKYPIKPGIRKIDHKVAGLQSNKVGSGFEIGNLLRRFSDVSILSRSLKSAKNIEFSQKTLSNTPQISSSDFRLNNKVIKLSNGLGSSGKRKVFV